MRWIGAAEGLEGGAGGHWAGECGGINAGKNRCLQLLPEEAMLKSNRVKAIGAVWRAGSEAVCGLQCLGYGVDPGFWVE